MSRSRNGNEILIYIRDLVQLIFNLIKYVITNIYQYTFRYNLTLKHGQLRSFGPWDPSVAEAITVSKLMVMVMVSF